MALRFIDSVAHYATDEITRKYLSMAAVTVASVSTRGGGQALRWTGGTASLIIALSPSKSTVTCGYALYIEGGFQLSSGGGYVISFEESGSRHIVLKIEESGLFSVRIPSGTHATSTVAITVDSWNYIEFSAVIHDSTGSYEVRLNGVNVLSASGLDTRNAGSGVCDAVRIVGAAGFVASLDANTAAYIKDVYVTDGDGSVNTGFLGDCRVECLYPTGNGNSSQLNGSDGNTTDNYLLVDDATDMDDDTTYVEGSTNGDKDTYGMGNLAASPASIAGVQLSVTATKTDSGSKSVTPVTRSGGTDYDGSSTALSFGSYLSVRQIRETDPNTSVAWTESGVNAVEVGAKVAA